MRRITSIVAVMLITIFALSSCSESSSAANAVPFSETVSGDGMCIWYECQNKIQGNKEDSYDLGIFDDEEEKKEEPEVVEYGRETKVVWIRVYKEGKLSTYSTTKNVYLGFFAKMTDEEIVNTLETETDTFICGQKEEPFDIYLYSDATGHEVKFEGVPTIIKQSKDDDPMFFMTLINGDSIPAFQVYDTFFGGYVLYNYDETPFDQACLVTKCEKGSLFGLDPLELENAVVDYATPEDMLREKNDELKKALKKAKKAASEETSEDAEG